MHTAQVLTNIIPNIVVCIPRTAVAFVVTNIVTVWCGVLFWFAVGGDVERDSSAAAVLELIYHVAYERDLSIVWPLLVFAALFLSGVITMVNIILPN